ncbi:MAG: hypothetical protein DRP56_00640 [Planctomycetota bacterium]|nr:MAG: hypothetical protein DRP56_00640 [Planctomycetota bacterium]
MVNKKILLSVVLLLFFTKTGFSISEKYLDSCGLRVAYFICKVHDIDFISLQEIANRIDMSQDGTTSFAGISEGLTSLGLNPKGVELSIEDLCNLTLPTILHLNTPQGPHFVIWSGFEKDKVVLIDPPNTQHLSRDKFIEQWDGYALIFLPSDSPKNKNILEDIKGPLICENSSQDLGDFILPLVKPVKVTFNIKNTSSGTLQIGRLIPSCGCTEVNISKVELKPNEDAEIVCSISEPPNSGMQQYTVSVPVLNKKIKPLQCNFQANFISLLSVKPKRLYLGRYLRSNLPEVLSVQILKVNDKAKPVILSTKSSSPWIRVVENSLGIEVIFSEQLPLGRFQEFLEIETDLGGINIPISGECIGGHRCAPNPVICNKNNGNCKFSIVKADNTCNLDELIFEYDESRIQIEQQKNSADIDRNEYEIIFLKNDTGSFHVKIINPVEKEECVLTILRLNRDS